MKWKKKYARLSLEPGDLEIMAQCRMPVTEMFRRQHPNKNIPPLWSVLSYVMLQCDANYVNIWERYRLLKELAANAKCWYHTCHIPKASGGIRNISVPKHQIRIQQEFILENILRGLPVSDYAYAYCRGRSIAHCAKPHIGQGVLIHLDITDFFGSITEDMVFEMFCRETGYAKSLCRLLAQLCCLRGRLPQGAATSPMLSNIVFRHCDEALACLARKHGLNYSRYSDDLFFSGPDHTNVGEVLKEVTSILLRHGFRLNKEKTQVRRRQHRQTVLGLTVNEHLQTSRDYRRKLLQELYYLEKFGKNCNGAMETGDYWKYMQQLQGKLAYALQIDPDNEKLWDAHLKLTLRMHHYARLFTMDFA